jgi:SAM-dependent methyltransferase
MTPVLPRGYVVDELAPHLGGNVLGGDVLSEEPGLWAWLVARYTPRVVLDLGCGEGHAAAAFCDLGCLAVGLDGLPWNVKQAARSIPCLCHDLTTGPARLAPVDLVWCCEVVEHVAPEHVGHLITTLALGRVVCLTHATPGQGGWHHVNEQPAGYWIGLMVAAGFRLDTPAAAEARALAHGWFSQSGLIFERED